MERKPHLLPINPQPEVSQDPLAPDHFDRMPTREELAAARSQEEHPQIALDRLKAQRSRPSPTEKHLRKE